MRLTAFGVGLIAIAAGCAHVPVRETAQYADSFGAVADVTSGLLDDYEAALTAIDAQSEAAQQAPAAYPVQFDPDAARAEDAVDPAVAGFRNALDAVNEYNRVLLALAQGDDGGRLEGRAAAAARLIESLGAGTAAAGVPTTELVRGLLALLAQARTRAEFAEALTRGRPIVEQVLDRFVGATPEFYRVRVGITGAAITEIEFQQEAVLAELERVARDYAAPAPGSELALRRAQVETDVAALRREVSSSAKVRPLPAGPLPYHDEAQARLDEQVRVLRALCRERRALAEGLAAYHDSLADYVRVLDDARGCFDLLLKAAGQTASPAAALEIHDTETKARDVDAALRGARSALALRAAAQP